MAPEGQRRAVFAFHVTVLRRGARAFSTTDAVVHDFGRQAATVCHLLRRWARDHGSGQSRRIRSRRSFDWPEHTASARTALKPLYHSGAEFPVSLFFYAQALVRTNGQGTDYFSGRIRNHG